MNDRPREPWYVRLWDRLNRPVTFLEVVACLFAAILANVVTLSLMTERQRELLWRWLAW